MIQLLKAYKTMAVMLMMIMMMMEAKKRTNISTITKRNFLRESKASQFSSVSDLVLI